MLPCHKTLFLMSHVHACDLVSLDAALEGCMVTTNLYGSHGEDDTADISGLDIHHLAGEACKAPWALHSYPTHSQLNFNATMDPASSSASDMGPLSSNTFSHYDGEVEHACAPLVQHNSCSGPLPIHAEALPAPSFALVRSCRARRSAPLGLRAEALKTAWHLRTIRHDSCPTPAAPPLQHRPECHRQDATVAPAARQALGRSLDSALPFWDDDGALLHEDSDAIMAEILGDELQFPGHASALCADACSGPLPMLACLHPMESVAALDARSPPVADAAGSPDHIFQDCLGAELSAQEDVGAAAGLIHVEAVCAKPAAGTCFSLPPPSVVEAAAAIRGCCEYAVGDSPPAWQQQHQQHAPRAGRSPSSSASDASVLQYSAERSIQNSPRPSAVSGLLASDSQVIRSGLDLGPRSGSVASAPMPAIAEVGSERLPEAAAALQSAADVHDSLGGSAELTTARQVRLPAQQSAPATPVAAVPHAPATGRAVGRAMKAEPGNGSRSPRSIAPKAPIAATKAKGKPGAARKPTLTKERVTGKGTKQVTAPAADVPVAGASATPSAAAPACQPAAAAVASALAPPVAAAAPAARLTLSSSCSIPASPMAALQALFEWQALSHRVVCAAAAPNQATAWDQLTDEELEVGRVQGTTL